MKSPKQYRYQFGVKWGWKKYNANSPSRPSPNIFKATSPAFNGGNNSLERSGDPCLVSFEAYDAIPGAGRKKRKRLPHLDDPVSIHIG